MLKTLPVKSLLFIFCILSSTRSSLVPALKYHCFFAVPEGEEHLSLGTGIRRWGQTTEKSFFVVLHIGSVSLGSLHHSTWAAAALPPETWCVEQRLCCGGYMKQACSPCSGLCRWNKNKIYVKKKGRGDFLGSGHSWATSRLGQPGGLCLLWQPLCRDGGTQDDQGVQWKSPRLRTQNKHTFAFVSTAFLSWSAAPAKVWMRQLACGRARRPAPDTQMGFQQSQRRWGGLLPPFGIIRSGWRARRNNWKCDLCWWGAEGMVIVIFKHYPMQPSKEKALKDLTA